MFWCSDVEILSTPLTVVSSFHLPVADAKTLSVGSVSFARERGHYYSIHGRKRTSLVHYRR